MNIKYYITLCFLWVSTISFGQVEFSAKAGKDQIALNERLKVSFEMNQDGDDFVPPDFKDFRVYAGPAQSISQSWRNGVSSFSKTYTYYLEPTKTGTLTIGQAQVTIEGKTYKTSPIQVEVTPAVDDPKDDQNRTIRDETEGIHLVAEISKTNPYLNEGVSVVYKLYVSPEAAISSWGMADIPKFSNFWNVDVNIKKNEIKYGTYKGDKNYRYVVLKRTILYPQKSGELSVEPLSLNIAIDVPTNRRDFFGRPVYSTVERTIASNSLNLNVKPLPEKGKPVDFNGAVGSFSISSSATKNELETGEALDVHLKITGTGNMKLFRIPSLKVPSSFEKYDPENKENINVNAGGTSGSLTDTYTLIPNAAGQFKIEPISFSYFDPQTESYKTIKTETLNLKVNPGQASAHQVATNSDGERTTPVHTPAISGKQFLYIKLKTKLKDINQTPFFNSNLFWGLLVSPLILLPIVLITGRKQQEKMQDIAGGRKKQADKLARRYLSEAKNKMGDQNAYYEALERALYNFLKAKLNIPVSEMTKSRITENLLQKGVEQNTAEEFISLLEACEFARYTPSTELGMQQDYDKATRIIAAVDKQMK